MDSKERSQIFDRISRIDSLEERIYIIEKELSPSWLTFKDDIKKFNFPFPPLSVDSDPNFHELIKRYYYSINIYIRETRDQGKTTIDLGPKTPDEWLFFNQHLMQRLIALESDPFECFDRKSSTVPDIFDLLSNELAKVSPLKNEVQEIGQSFDSSSLDIGFMAMEGRYNWKKRFMTGFSSIVLSNKLNFHKYIKLPDLFFLSLGRMYGNYYYYLIDRLKEAKKEDPETDLYVVGDISMTTPKRLMLLHSLGFLDQIKSILNVNSYTQAKMVTFLHYLLGLPKTTIKEPLKFFNSPADIEFANDDINPRSREQNYNDVLRILEIFGLHEQANGLNTELELRKEKGLIRKLK